MVWNISKYEKQGTVIWEKGIRQWMHGTCIYLRYDIAGKFVLRVSVAGLMRTGTDIFLYGKGNTVYLYYKRA